MALRRKHLRFKVSKHTLAKLFKFSIFLLPLIIVFSQCLYIDKKEDPRGPAYAGSEACINCHKNIYGSYLHTAHYQSARPSDGQTISGSFEEEKNTFAFSPTLKVVMEKYGDGFFQRAYDHSNLIRSERFDITFGGVKGETYAYWKDNQLFELPISYAANVHNWINSPGYSYGAPNFDRPVITACLDCHLSFAKTQPAKTPGFYGSNTGFSRDSMVFSIDCERCHGPAAEHVKFHMDNPDVKDARYITKFSSLSRAQKINMCAMCHSGTQNPALAKPTFAFNPNERVSPENSTILKGPIDYNHVDVHGNQKALLSSSKCFINSNMDCSTCHDTHVKDRDQPLLYTARCMNCHNADSHNTCKLASSVSLDVLKNNCISCHMPAFSSKLIIAGTSGTLIHTHHIAVYPQETQKILAYLNLKAK